MNNYKIDELRGNVDLFEEFKREIPSSWRDFHDVDQFIEVFCAKNSCCEIYPVDVKFDRAHSVDEEAVFEKFKGDARIEGYEEVEIGINKFITLYGFIDLESWDEDSQCYGAMSFGDYYEIEVD